MLRRETRRPEREDAAARDAIASLEATPPILHPVVDDQLRLIFTCCHPALPRDAHVELTLRLVCGLRVPEIARALLRGEEAVNKRIQRAKAKVRTAAIPLRVPPPELLDERLPSVLDCTYLTFTEGYAATAGDDLVRHELCDEGIRLARLIVELLPGRAGPEALLALLLLQDAAGDRLASTERATSSSSPTRTGPAGTLTAVAEGMAWLDRASAHPEVTASEAAYLFQAAIAAEHSAAPTWEATDWAAIVSHYDQLAALTDVTRRGAQPGRRGVPRRRSSGRPPAARRAGRRSPPGSLPSPRAGPRRRASAASATPTPPSARLPGCVGPRPHRPRASPHRAPAGGPAGGVSLDL